MHRRILPVAVARSCSDRIAICYVLPVLWITWWLHITARHRRRKRAYNYAQRDSLRGRTVSETWCLRLPCPILIDTDRSRCCTLVRSLIKSEQFSPPTDRNSVAFTRSDNCHALFINSGTYQHRPCCLIMLTIHWLYNKSTSNLQQIEPMEYEHYTVSQKKETLYSCPYLC